MLRQLPPTPCVAFVILLLVAACSSQPKSPDPYEEPPLASVSRAGNRTILTLSRCPDDQIFFITNATGPEVERILLESAVPLVSTWARDPDRCLDPEARVAMVKERAAHQALVDEHLAELANRCDDLFIEVNEPNVYERHTVCPGDEWASLERTHKCDDMMIAGEQDEPSFQCRPVIEPPVF